MPEENVIALRRGFELWNTAAGDPDEKTWCAAMAETVSGYHSEAEMDFSRTLPDFPTTGTAQAMTGWIEAARETFTDLSIRPQGQRWLLDGRDRPAGRRAAHTLGPAP